jgi:hypothetical protein
MVACEHGTIAPSGGPNCPECLRALLNEAQAMLEAVHLVLVKWTPHLPGGSRSVAWDLAEDIRRALQGRLVTTSEESSTSAEAGETACRSRSPGGGSEEPGTFSGATVSQKEPR